MYVRMYVCMYVCMYEYKYAYMCIYIYIYIVTWSTTARREKRNFPYPSVFELTGLQRLTVKKRNRNVGQFLAADVTNPGQYESQQMFALTDRVKEIVVRTNRLTEEKG